MEDGLHVSVVIVLVNILDFDDLRLVFDDLDNSLHFLKGVGITENLQRDELQ